VFYIVKLTAALKDPISERCSKLPPDLVIVNREEEWEVEKILDNHWHYKKY